MNEVKQLLEYLKSNSNSKLEFETKKVEFERMLTKMYSSAVSQGIRNCKESFKAPRGSKGKNVLSYMGITIRKATNCNKWYTRFRIGKKQYYLSADTQIECYNKLVYAKSEEGIRERLKEQNYLFPNMTFYDWYERWIDLYKKDKVSEETLRSYKTLINSLPEDFKNLKLREIRLVNVIELINGTGRDRQRQKLHEFLNMLFEKAFDNELITYNFIRKIDKPKHQKTHSIALTLAEQNILIETCKDIPNAEVLMVALYQGYRRGEVLGITRDCLDFANRRIFINKAWSQRNKFSTTKNIQSNRNSPMFDKTYKILAKYRFKQPEERIFNISIKQYELMLKKVREDSGLVNLKIKDLRSTFITNCMNKGIPEHIIQAWVGHQIGSIVTSSVYTTFHDGADIEYIKQYNKFAKKNYK